MVIQKNKQISKGLKELTLAELDIQKIARIFQNMVILESGRILREVLEYWEDFLFFNLWYKPQVTTSKNTQWEKKKEYYYYKYFHAIPSVAVMASDFNWYEVWYDILSSWIKMVYRCYTVLQNRSLSDSLCMAARCEY